jgi:hypothetical protein
LRTLKTNPLRPLLPQMRELAVDQHAVRRLVWRSLARPRCRLEGRVGACH